MDTIVLPIVIESDEDQYHAWVPTLPGCHTFGATIEEALENIREAASLHLELMAEQGESFSSGNASVVLTSLTLSVAS